MYAQPRPQVEDFCFDDSVARVFPDMIERSVPGYAGMLDLLALVADQRLQPGDRCYDLGCSRGAVGLVLAGTRHGSALDIVAVDNSPAMIERLRERLDQEPGLNNVRPLCADIRDVEIRDAAVVVLNLTLQFIPREHRLALLTRIRQGMKPGGLLYLSEKLRFDDPGEQSRMDELQEDFKRSRGYSDLEIAQKRTALEQVLLPDTESQHLQRLHHAGFAESRTLFRCLNFAAFAAWA